MSNIGVYKKYWLTQNMMYNCTHVVRVNKLKRFLRWGGFGYKLVMTECFAISEESARVKFKSRGYQVGLGF